MAPGILNTMVWFIWYNDVRGSVELNFTFIVFLISCLHIFIWRNICHGSTWTWIDVAKCFFSNLLSFSSKLFLVLIHYGENMYCTGWDIVWMNGIYLKCLFSLYIVDVFCCALREGFRTFVSLFLYEYNIPAFRHILYMSNYWWNLRKSPSSDS